MKRKNSNSVCILTERNAESMKKFNCWEYKQNIMMSAPIDRPKRTPGLSDLAKHGFLKLSEDIRLDKIDNVVHLKNYVSPNISHVDMIAVLEKIKGYKKIQGLMMQSLDCITDKHLVLLLEVLMHSDCNIWFINIEEFNKVSTHCWYTFAENLSKTKVTHMYASENLFSTDLKKQMMVAI